MIEIKKCNYITGDTISVSFGLGRIIDFFDLAGKNQLLITKPKDSDKSALNHNTSISRLDFKNKHEFDEIIENKSNLFRIDLIIVDLWHINSVSSVIDYKEKLDKLGIDYIIVSNKYHFKESDDIKIYKIEHESDPVTFDSKYWITDIISGWRSTMKDLILSYKRDKKLGDIFGDV